MTPEVEMPLYEYECRDCGTRFEALVTAGHRPVCPSCHSEKLEKLLSVFGVGPGGSSGGRVADTGGCGSGGG